LKGGTCGKKIKDRKNVLILEGRKKGDPSLREGGKERKGIS